MKVMFLCTGNSCRSQMAEGFARRYGGDILDVHSAGLAPVGVNRYAARVMAEVGIDISKQKSKAIDPELLTRMDVVITLCGHAEALCPRVPGGARKLHWPIVDPVGATGTDEEIMAEFRRAREEIKALVIALVENLRTRLSN